MSESKAAQELRKRYQEIVSQNGTVVSELHDNIESVLAELAQMTKEKDIWIFNAKEANAAYIKADKELRELKGLK